MVVTFGSPVTVGGVSIASGSATPTFSVAGTVVTINLAGVTDVQRLAVTLSNVSSGANVGSVIIPMGVLSADTNSSGAVSGTDVSQTKSAASTGTVTSANFRTDVNVSGSVNASDVSTVKGRSGNILPP